jgi:hypothetical protein
MRIIQKPSCSLTATTTNLVDNLDLAKFPQNRTSIGLRCRRTNCNNLLDPKISSRVLKKKAQSAAGVVVVVERPNSRGNVSRST